MPENQLLNVGDKLVLCDLTAAPEGAWVVHETMQFIRSGDGRNAIRSITPIQGMKLPTGKGADRYTLIYAGPSTVEKSRAVNDVVNSL